MIQTEPLLHYDIEDVQQLYASYLPFVMGGAMFIPVASNQYQLGDSASVLIRLPDAKVDIAISGHVVWINTKSQAGRPKGIAIQIADNKLGQSLNEDIEQRLANAGMTDSLQATYTM